MENKEKFDLPFILETYLRMLEGKILTNMMVITTVFIVVGLLSQSDMLKAGLLGYLISKVIWIFYLIERVKLDIKIPEVDTITMVDKTVTYNIFGTYKVNSLKDKRIQPSNFRDDFDIMKAVLSSKKEFNTIVIANRSRIVVAVMDIE